MDALSRTDSWAFKPNFYYIILLIAALFGLAGILRIMKSGSKPQNATGTISEGGDSRLDEIKKAKELLDAGAINATEFDKIKKEALDR